jgi:hypothetical protein
LHEKDTFLFAVLSNGEILVFNVMDVRQCGVHFVFNPHVDSPITQVTFGGGDRFMFLLTADNRCYVYSIGDMYSLPNKPVYVYNNLVWKSRVAGEKSLSRKPPSIIKIFVDGTSGYLWIICTDNSIKKIDLRESVYTCYLQFDRIIRSCHGNFDHINDNNIVQKITYWCPKNNMNLFTYSLAMSLYLLQKLNCFLDKQL